MYLCLNKLTSKHRKGIALIFYMYCIKLKNVRVSFFHSFSHFLFSLLVMQRITSFILSTGLFWKKGCSRIAGFLQLSTLFVLCICKYTLWLSTRVGRKPSWFLCRINNIQKENTYERNFNLIISDSRLFNIINMRIGLYLKQRQLCSISL